MQPKISIIHPSRSRPEMAAKTAKKWLSSAKDSSSIQYILSVDMDENIPSYGEAFAMQGLLSPEHMRVAIHHNKSAIEAINKAAELTIGKIIITISDDFDCPFHWDVALLSMLEGKEDYLVKTKDGIQKTLITLPIMDRKYYERFGYIYNPAYQHMFCDQEMTAVGHLLGRVVELDITFPHRHYSIGGMQKDAINEKNDATWRQGEQTYFSRLQNNFGIENPVINYSQIQWH